ncbi:MAG: hypothetical protein IJR26_08895 [Bacteroidales bacterium]|nr:hypothetical protein [Bacteroidales bacterium]
MKKYILPLVALLLLLSSCRKEKLEIVNPHHRRVDNFTQQFEAVWTGIDYGYLFWDRDTVDWDARHDELLPIFQDFDSRRNVSDDEVAMAYQQLVRGLLDHHMQVSVRNLLTGHEFSVDPAIFEVPSRPYYHYTYLYNQIDILKSLPGITDFTEGTGSTRVYTALLPGTGDKKIAYLRFTNFYLTYQCYGNYNGWLPLRKFFGNDPINGVTDGWAGSDDVEAIIIDVRGNGGGMLQDLRTFMGALAPSRLDLGYSRTKEGLGRLDYSAWTPFFIDPPANHLDGSKKIVLLTDVNSVSCSEITALMVQAIPNAVVIGERTYGATCPLIDGGNDMLYSGVFGDLEKYGYYVYTSNFDLVDKNFYSHEGVGVEPDIECLFDIEALADGHDNQLDRALEFIRSGK